MKKKSILGTLLLCASCVLGGELPAWKIRGLPPDIKPLTAESAARWVWHGGVQRDGTECWFRYTFNLEASPTNGVLHVAADDVGEYWINGVAVKSAGIIRGMKSGRNVLAIHVKNIYSSGGLLIYGHVALANGACFPLHSTAAFRVSAVKPAADWEKETFDDRTWTPATEMGDVWLHTFARYRNFAKDFASDSERAQHDARLEKISAARENAFAKCVFEKDDPVCKVVYEGARPFISVNGVRYEPDFALYMMQGVWEASVVRKLRSLGVRFFRIRSNVDKCEVKAGEYSFDELDEQMRKLLQEVPDAMVCLQLRVRLEKWCAAHPEELIGYADGPVDTKSGDERVTRPRRPSAASLKYRAELRRYFDALGAYVKKQPWHSRVVMVRPCWGIYTEWHTYGMYHAPDVGPAMTAAFRNYKGGIYASENPPTMAERTHGGTMLNPKADRKIIDYYACMAEQVADLLTFCCGEAKRVLPGRLAGAYYGYVFATHPPEGANVLLERVLSSPNVDFLSNPANYSAMSRRAGGSYYERSIPAVFHRYGKLPIIEDDMRFHHISNYCVKAICTETPRESRVTASRNYLNKLFDGSGIQFLDPMSNWGARLYNFDDPDVLEGLHEGMEATRKAGILPRESGNTLAVVVSARERLMRDGAPFSIGTINSDIYGNAPHELYRAGVTFDLLELADYLNNPAPYRQVVFLNAFNLTAEERTKLKAATTQAGVNALWLVAPGCGTEQGFSDAAMRELTGLMLVGSGCAPAVTCVDAATEKTSWGGHLKRRENGGATYFLGHVPRGISMWQKVLKDIGAHVWVKEDAYVRHHGDLLLFHTAKGGAYSIALPVAWQGKTFSNLITGHTYHANTSLALETDGPETFLFKIYDL